MEVKVYLDLIAQNDLQLDSRSTLLCHSQLKLRKNTTHQQLDSQLCSSIDCRSLLNRAVQTNQVLDNLHPNILGIHL
jgi:hypothetical protein